MKGLFEDARKKGDQKSTRSFTRYTLIIGNLFYTKEVGKRRKRVIETGS